MILTSVPCIMICHDLDKGTMVNHDLARFTKILTRVPWLRTLGSPQYTDLKHPEGDPENRKKFKPFKTAMMIRIDPRFFNSGLFFLTRSLSVAPYFARRFYSRMKHTGFFSLKAFHKTHAPGKVLSHLIVRRVSPVVSRKSCRG